MRLRALAIAAPIAAAAVAATVLAATDSGPSEKPAPPTACRGEGTGVAGGTPVRATGFDREVIRRAPYAAWVGAWTMPGGRMMVGFTQAEGPVDPARRAAAPEALKQQLGVAGQDPTHDFWGLDLSAEYLTSDDQGATWVPFRSDRFRAVYPHAYAASATVALEDGTILRRVNGYDLLHDPQVPHTAFLQRLEPGTQNWSEPQVLMDPDRFTYQISRLRRLTDGCLVAVGQYWAVPAGTPHDVLTDSPVDHLMLVSADDGQTWRQNPVEIPEGVYVQPNEWDVAELSDGDLLAMFRTRAAPDSDEFVRRQGRLERDGDGWVLTDVRDAPFAHSGHPELLATRQGPILHVATTGTMQTVDGGETWQPLEFRGRTPAETAYYPVALQDSTGAVHVFGHVGFDHGYGEVPGEIVMDSFGLER